MGGDVTGGWQLLGQSEMQLEQRGSTRAPPLPSNFDVEFPPAASSLITDVYKYNYNNSKVQNRRHHSNLILIVSGALRAALSSGNCKCFWISLRPQSSLRSSVDRQHFRESTILSACFRFGQQQPSPSREPRRWRPSPASGPATPSGTRSDSYSISKRINPNRIFFKMKIPAPRMKNV